MRFDVDDPNIQPLRIFPYKMPASMYNTIRLGILRIRDPLVLTLKRQPNIKFFLNNRRWIVMDTILFDFPLVVWRDFETKNRAIHESVNCKVYVYHMMAGRLMGTALYEVEEYLNDLLHRAASETPSNSNVT